MQFEPRHSECYNFNQHIFRIKKNEYNFSTFFLKEIARDV